MSFAKLVLFVDGVGYSLAARSRDSLISAVFSRAADPTELHFPRALRPRAIFFPRLVRIVF